MICLRRSLAAMRLLVVVFVVVDVILACTLSSSWSYEPGTIDRPLNHPGLTEVTLEVFNRLFPERAITSIAEKNALIIGSIDEDAGGTSLVTGGLSRAVNHFYDPTTCAREAPSGCAGLTLLEIIPLLTIDSEGVKRVTPASALAWAERADLQLQLAYPELTQPFDFPSTRDRSW